MIHSRSRPITTALLPALGAFVALLAATSLSAAAISVDNSHTSGEIDEAVGSTPDSFSTTYNNTTDFLVVMTTASADNGKGTWQASDSPTVTYAGAPMTEAVFETGNDFGGVMLHYLKNPAIGSNSLVVDFDTALSSDDTARFQVGALSLLNVDLLDPVAEIEVWPQNDAGDSSIDHTMTSTVPGAISAGDFLGLVAYGNNRLTERAPIWQTPDESMSQLFLTNANGHPEDSVAEYGTLTVDDLSGANNDELFLDNAEKRTGFAGGVVFNSASVIPEPTSACLLLTGGLAMLRRRR